MMNFTLNNFTFSANLFVIYSASFLLSALVYLFCSKFCQQIRSEPNALGSLLSGVVFFRMGKETVPIQEVHYPAVHLNEEDVAVDNPNRLHIPWGKTPSDLCPVSALPAS